MEPGTSPRTVTTKRKIKYMRSSWNVHEFEVWSGAPLFKVTALKMERSLLLWVGGTSAGDAVLGEMALALPGRAACTTLLGACDGAGDAAALARRVAAARGCPVFACFARPLDRFTAPLLSKAISAEIETHPECF